MLITSSNKDFLSDFQYSFSSSTSTADLLTDESHKSALTFYWFWDYSSYSNWVNEVLQGAIFRPTLFQLYITDFIDLICNIAIYVDATPNLGDTIGWRMKWLVDFNAGKTHLVSIDQSKNSCATDGVCSWRKIVL